MSSGKYIAGAVAVVVVVGGLLAVGLNLALSEESPRPEPPNDVYTGEYRHVPELDRCAAASTEIIERLNDAGIAEGRIDRQALEYRKSARDSQGSQLKDGWLVQKVLTLISVDGAKEGFAAIESQPFRLQQPFGARIAFDARSIRVELPASAVRPEREFDSMCDRIRSMMTVMDNVVRWRAAPEGSPAFNWRDAPAEH